jgi:hypothetical protein
MTTMFIGGSLGSWAAAQAYERWGWTGACAAAAAFPAIGLLGWLAARRHEGVRSNFWSERTRGESQRYVRTKMFFKREREQEHQFP